MAFNSKNINYKYAYTRSALTHRLPYDFNRVEREEFSTNSLIHIQLQIPAQSALSKTAIKIYRCIFADE